MAITSPWAHMEPRQRKDLETKRNLLLNGTRCQGQAQPRDADTWQGMCLGTGHPGVRKTERKHGAAPCPHICWGSPGAQPSPHHSSPGFNHLSLTRSLLLLTAHLLALVKYAVNCERISPALPDWGSGQEGAGSLVPRARLGSVHACSQHQQPRGRERRP